MIYTKETLKDAIIHKLRLNYGCTVEYANEAEMMKASALVLRDIMAERDLETREKTRREEKRQVHYM